MSCDIMQWEVFPRITILLPCVIEGFFFRCYHERNHHFFFAPPRLLDMCINTSPPPPPCSSPTYVHHTLCFFFFLVRRSASVPVDDADDPCSSFHSTPGASELMAAPTPGRESEGERTWIMAKRVASGWEEEERMRKNGDANGNMSGGPSAVNAPSPATSKTCVFG